MALKSKLADVHIPEDISWFQFVFQNFENYGDKTAIVSILLIATEFLLEFPSLWHPEYDFPTSVDSFFSLPFASVERQFVLNQEQSRQRSLKKHVEKSLQELGRENIFDM